MVSGSSRRSNATQLIWKQSKTLSPEQVAVFRELFNSYDLDGDGGITVEEYAKEIKATEEELKKMIKDLDKNGDDKMDFEEWLSMMTGGGKLPEQEEPKSADSDKSIEDVIDQS
ncbi:hypothetical protein B0O99DRAFT_588678 [Bisporella sp. PMI_857]|nr:hypothetical protein B0O99DRAFT_588678 [Bisporella sp. PMI_857]